MNAIVVGADRLGSIPSLLKGIGIEISRHITGRFSAHQKMSGVLPKDAELLILFTDFLNHNAMRGFRAQAEARGIPVVACRRSASCLIASLGKVLGAKACAQCPQR